MRIALLPLLSISLSPLAAECPDTRYLPGNYSTGARINMREIGNFLEKNGIEARDLKYLEKPGARDGADWLKGVEYTDIESMVVMTREREKELIALVCFSSEQKLLLARRKLFAEQKRLEQKSGKKFSFDEKTGEGVLDGGEASFFMTKRSFVFGDSKVVNQFKDNYRKNQANSQGFVARLGESKAEIMISVDTKALGQTDTRDLPDFAGMREIVTHTRAFEMQLALKGRPQITASMVMTNSAMARRVSALFNVFKELAVQFSGNVNEREARKAVTSLLSRMEFRAKGKRAELNLKLNKMENALLIAWLAKEISEGKERHATYKVALEQEQICNEILSGKFAQTRAAKLKNLNLKTSEGNYLLHCAAAVGDKELVKTLIKHGAKAELINGKDESAYEAAFNAGHFGLSESLLPRKGALDVHRALVSLAKRAPGLHLTTQADGRRVIRLKSPLEFGEDTIKLEPFEFAWDKSNPLVHPPREDAVYDVVFTLGQFMESEEANTDDAEDEDVTANKNGLNGTLVSAQDPEYKAEPESESPTETETVGDNEDASSTDRETGAEAETEPENG